VAARLLEAGATPSATNFAGRTPVEEAQQELKKLERHSNGTGAATRRNMLREAIDTPAPAIGRTRLRIGEV
jgi:hypothetical protein